MPPDWSLVPSPDLEAVTLEDRLLHHFYSWEYRGRGWMLYDLPVALEPPFRPFYWELVDSGPPPNDDGRRHTWLSGLIARITERPRKAVPEALDYSHLRKEPDPEVVMSTGLTSEIRVTVPPGFKVSHEACRRFFQVLKYLRRPLSFEIVGTGEAISIQFVCHPEDEGTVVSQLVAYFPECVLRRNEGSLQAAWEERSLLPGLVVDFGLSEEFMLPLHVFSQYDPDPLTAVAGAMQGLAQGDVAVFQVLMQPVLAPWGENLLRAVFDGSGAPVFADFPDLAKMAREKISCELFATGVRIAVRCTDTDRNWPVMRALGGALAQFSRPGGNELIPLTNDGYDRIDHEIDLVERRSRRSGMILNAEEVLTLVHLPSASVRSSKLSRTIKKEKAPPALATGGDWVLGYHVHDGVELPVTLTADQRSRHLYAIGASGTGKSTFLLHLIRQDLENGEGFAVLDPHGDLIDAVIGFLPEKRLADVVLIDPSDEEYPVGLNILAAHSQLEKTLLSSDLVAVFRRLSTSWGDQMNSVLSNAILAFLESGQGGTLRDLRRFLVDKEYRQRFLSTVEDSEVRYYWLKEFPLLTGKPQAPILTRLDTFLRPKPIRYMVAQKESKLDFRKLMDEGKVVLARLSQGAIGEENAYLLGSLLVSTFHRIAMGRQEQKAEDRRPFHLYIDECHHFVTPSMASILAGARKYRLSLILAHQELRQIGNLDVASAVLTNPHTRVCFRVGDQDARKLAEGFSYFDASDLQNLGTGEAIARIERAEYDFNLSVPPLPAADERRTESNRERVVRRTRERYATHRSVIEEFLADEGIDPESFRQSKSQKAPREGREEAAHPPTTHMSLSAPSEPLFPVLSEQDGGEAPHPPTETEPPASAPQERKPKPRPALPPSPGRGGREHKRLQNLIQMKGTELGYRVSTEKHLPGGGFVDVALEAEGQRIACEISVTSTPDQEIGNVQKCLKDGFDTVVLVVSEPKRISKIRSAISGTLTESELRCVGLFSMPEFLLFLEELSAKRKFREGNLRGYKVKTEFNRLDRDEKERKKLLIADAIAKSVTRSGAKKPK